MQLAAISHFVMKNIMLYKSVNAVMFLTLIIFNIIACVELAGKIMILDYKVQWILSNLHVHWLYNFI